MPNIQPIKKLSQLEFLFLTSIKKNNKVGKVKKFIISKLYGGKLNELVAPIKNGIKNNIKIFLVKFINL